MKQYSAILDNPRLQAINAMKASVDPDVWQENQAFISSLKDDLAKHPLTQHPIKLQLTTQKLSLQTVQQIHLDYRHAIVQVFTDALTMAMVQTRQLEPRLTPGAKIAPRFLLTLNTLDEFGFQPGLDKDAYYRGNPAFAHYPLFEGVLDELKLSPQARNTFKPSAEASELLDFMEDAFFNYKSILTLLAVAEIQVILFSPPLKKSAEYHKVSVDSGYYFVHGTNDDDTTEASDDDHEDDLWHALAQACTPADFQNLRDLALRYMDLWADFWNHQSALIPSTNEEKISA